MQVPDKHPFCYLFAGPAVLRFRSKIQQIQSIDFGQHNLKQLTNVTNFISVTNDPTLSYKFSASSGTYGQHFKVWDLGSAECDSIDSSLCARFLKPPSSGCGGAGCGVGEWQSLSGECEGLPKAYYDISERKGRSFVWPTSVLNDYYSLCNDNSTYTMKTQDDHELDGRMRLGPNCQYVKSSVLLLVQLTFTHYCPLPALMGCWGLPIMYMYCYQIKNHHKIVSVFCVDF